MSAATSISSVSGAASQATAMTHMSHARAAGLKGSALRHASPDMQRAAVSSQFEAIIVRQLLGKTMTSMLGGEKSGAAGSVYGDMLTDTFAQQLTAGGGLGLSRMLEKQLTPRGTVLPSTAPGSVSDVRALAATSPSSESLP